MRYELTLHRITVGALMVVLLAFVSLLLTLHPLFTDRSLEILGSLVIIVLAATAFVFMGMLEGIMAFYFGKNHKREVLSYVSLGLLSLGCAFFITISHTASAQTVALVAAPHAFLFGLAELRLGQPLHRHPTYKRGLLLGGIVEILLGLALVIGYRLSVESVVILLGYVATVSILQLFPLVVYWHIGYADKEPLQASSHS